MFDPITLWVVEDSLSRTPTKKRRHNQSAEEIVSVNNDESLTLPSNVKYLVLAFVVKMLENELKPRWNCYVSADDYYDLFCYKSLDRQS